MLPAQRATSIRVVVLKRRRDLGPRFWNSRWCRRRAIEVSYERTEVQMKNRFSLPMILLIVVIALASSSPLMLTAQTSKAKPWHPPRTADGHPDLQGTWNYSTLTPLERPRDLADKAFFSELEAAEFENRARQNRNVDLNRETTPTARGVINGTVETEDLASAYN